ncbi:MAG TPA: alpha/beta hydrolase [Rhizobiaceae bacterium]|nr:alpha/beta hydrolase [Rhizobiaceae bacterium]
MRFDLHQIGDITLHVASAGDPAKPLILMLHGFPEFWAGWESVMEELAADFHVVAPDQRGYNLSSKPQGVDAYKARALVNDIAALADRLSLEKPFVLAGHDWGASIAYGYAFRHPGRLSHFIIANGVHPVCFQRAILDNPEQREASQYINKLKRPGQAERLAENDFARGFSMLSGFSATPWMTDDLKARYLEAWSRPGAMEAMLNWYRASPIVVPEPGEVVSTAPVLELDPAAVTVRVPHLLIWGDDDTALRPSCIADLDQFTPDLTVKHIAGTGHWLLHEKPEEVAEAIRHFVS